MSSAIHENLFTMPSLVHALRTNKGTESNAHVGGFGQSPRDSENFKRIENSEIPKRYRKRGLQNQMSRSMIERMLKNEELREMLQAEVAKSGVVTASGYQAVLQKFLLSEAVVKELEEEAKSWDTDEISPAEKELSSRIRDNYATQRKGIDSLSKSPSGYGQQADRKEIAPSRHHQQKSQPSSKSANESQGSPIIPPKLKLTLSASSSAFQESINSFFTTPTQDNGSFKEIPLHSKESQGRVRNLAPRKPSVVIPSEYARQVALSEMRRERLASTKGRPRA